MEYYDKSNYIAHYGIKGMHWGERRYQNVDGSLTDAGRSRYGITSHMRWGEETRKAVSEWYSNHKKNATRAKALRKAAKVRKAQAKEKEKAEKEQKRIEKLKRETELINARTAKLKAKIAAREAKRERKQQLLSGIFGKTSSNQNANNEGKKDGDKKKDNSRSWFRTVDAAAKAGVAAVITNSLKNRFTYERQKSNSPSASDAASKKEKAVKDQAEVVPDVSVDDIPNSTSSSGAETIDDLLFRI